MVGAKFQLCGYISFIAIGKIEGPLFFETVGITRKIVDRFQCDFLF